MLDLKNAAMAMASLSVYKGITDRTIPGALYRLLWCTERSEEEFLNAWGDLFSKLCDCGYSDHLAQAVSEAALFDENAFSRAAASGEYSLPAALVQAVKRDLKIIRNISLITPEDILGNCGFGTAIRKLCLPRWETGRPAAPFEPENPDKVFALLQQYYRKSGCGMFAQFRAFTWRERKIVPISYPDPVRLKNLKGYRLQREDAIQNTKAFLGGFPANNCLLYGDRGTGKSSTVKALLNEFYPEGLRMIEMPKESLADFPVLIEKIAESPMKFILFIDDLSFSRQDDTYTALKAVLEGGLAVRPENVIIYATSNRRHLVRETFSDREGDEIHRGDTIQESLSLADRFGLTINYSLPDREEFLMILRCLAEQRGLKKYIPQMEAGAERWAIARGGRSPRCAKQYVRYAEGCLNSGQPLK